MPSNDPRNRRGPAVGGSRDDDDDERPVNKNPLRRSSTSVVSRGGGNVEEDPERLEMTTEQPPLSVNKPLSERRRRPSIVERGRRPSRVDPGRNQKTNTHLVPEPSGVDSNEAPMPESSEAEWEAPPGKMSREMVGPEYETGNNYGGDEGAEGAPDYQTGNEYQPIAGEEGDEISISGVKSLEGDGLDALDPELDVVRSKTGTQQAKNPDVPGGGEAEDEGDDDENATHAGPPLKLEIISGPDTGRKKKFKGVRMVIGRTPGVDLQLTDQSVSRRHVELIVGDAGVMLRDLGSGNGSKVNGEKVTEHLLQHGDEIAIGKTKIRFVDEAGAIKKAREEAEKKEAEEKAAAEAAAAAAVAGEGEGAEAKGEGEEGEEQGEAAEGEEGAEGGEGGEADGAGEGEAAASEGGEQAEGSPSAASGAGEAVKTARQLNKDAPKKSKRNLVFAGIAVLVLGIVVFAATRSKAPPPPDPLKTQAAEKMQQARDAVRAEKYEEAIKLIEDAEKLVPGIDQTRLATQARNELAVVTVLEDVRRLIDAKKFEDARAALAKAPQGSVKTEEAKKKLGDELAEAEASYKKERFQQMIAEGEVEAASQLMPELSPADKREMAPVLEEAKAALEKSRKEEAVIQAKAAATKAEHVRSQKAESMAVAFAVVQRKFTGQEWARAAAECDRVVDQNPGDDELRKRSKQLQNLIPNYGRYYEDGMKKFRANQIAASVKPLRKAWELYQLIDLQSPMGDELKEKLAQAALFNGKEALLRDDLPTAAIDFREAAKLDPEEPKARELLNEVIGRADEVYQGAYMIRDRDPQEALKRFRVVVEITPPGSTIHEKAKNQIAAMSP